MATPEVHREPFLHLVDVAHDRAMTALTRANQVIEPTSVVQR
jgi:hypothetical protein